MAEGSGENPVYYCYMDDPITPSVALPVNESVVHRASSRILDGLNIAELAWDIENYNEEGTVPHSKRLQTVLARFRREVSHFNKIASQKGFPEEKIGEFPLPYHQAARDFSSRLINDLTRVLSESAAQDAPAPQRAFLSYHARYSNKLNLLLSSGGPKTSRELLSRMPREKMQPGLIEALESDGNRAGALFFLSHAATLRLDRPIKLINGLSAEAIRSHVKDHLSHAGNFFKIPEKLDETIRILPPVELSDFVSQEKGRGAAQPPDASPPDSWIGRTGRQGGRNPRRPSGAGGDTPPPDAGWSL